ncbi:MAG: FecR family protein [Thermodesulfobacteriota bacterium]
MSRRNLSIAIEIALLTLAMTVMGNFGVNYSFAQEPESIGIVTAVNGQVTVISSGGTQAVVEGTRVFLGDRFETGDNSGVKIIFNDDTLISLGANANFEITEFVYTPTTRKSLSNLIKGKVKAIIQDFPGGDSEVEFATPNAVAGIKGTTLYIDEVGVVYASEGEIFVRCILAGDREVTLVDGNYTEIMADGDCSEPAPIPPDLRDQLIQDTTVAEEAPEDESYTEDYPGKERPGKESPYDLSGLVTAPLAQPVDLLPGTDPFGRAPVDVIINP